MSRNVDAGARRHPIRNFVVPLFTLPTYIGDARCKPRISNTERAVKFLVNKPNRRSELESCLDLSIESLDDIDSPLSWPQGLALVGIAFGTGALVGIGIVVIT